MTQRVIVYIDALNLYHGLRDIGWRHCLWLDIYQLSLNILGKNQRLEKIHYFTTEVLYDPQDKYKLKRHRTYLKALRELNKVYIHCGYYQKKERMHHECGKNHKFVEEKMTDVNIATNLLCDAHDDLFDVAIIISGDSDLVSAVEAISNRFQNKEAVVYFPPRRSSPRLASVASRCSYSDERVFQRSQLPNPFITSHNQKLWRPSTWQ
ncbi:MAG: NYN domain-containing protein [Caldilineaceae bacterium SB0670_bin_27]|uniref:NYN domain-containing protein n=1 Tax=Caldilineaceae bacterium SB0664_bin_27 TaxID=2605260 RepID=A0A6B0YVG7_9CHLR|nr:NYN domain-containing protein [Caldilineaceae bacterium SB0664_bin_27]MYJ79458.1 NYN domain-containing protein [Caldilineaceae bacterium SB0670_bin_27]